MNGNEVYFDPEDEYQVQPQPQAPQPQQLYQGGYGAYDPQVQPNTMQQRAMQQYQQNANQFYQNAQQVPTQMHSPQQYYQQPQPQPAQVDDSQLRAHIAGELEARELKRQGLGDYIPYIRQEAEALIIQKQLENKPIDVSDVIEEAKEKCFNKLSKFSHAKAGDKVKVAAMDLGMSGSATNVPQHKKEFSRMSQEEFSKELGAVMSKRYE